MGFELAFTSAQKCTVLRRTPPPNTSQKDIQTWIWVRFPYPPQSGFWWSFIFMECPMECKEHRSGSPVRPSTAQHELFGAHPRAGE